MSGRMAILIRYDTISRKETNRMQLWVSLASEAACAAALQHAVAMCGIYDTETLQAVLQHDAMGLARALCTALRTEAPSCSSTGTQTKAAGVGRGCSTSLNPCQRHHDPRLTVRTIIKLRYISYVSSPPSGATL